MHHPILHENIPLTLKTHIGLIAKTYLNTYQTQLRWNSDVHKKDKFSGNICFLLAIAQQTWGYQAEMPISARSPLISTIIMKTLRN